MTGVAGSDAERRAANDLARRLAGLGREGVVEPTRVAPDFALTHLAHAVVAIVGSVLAVYEPVAGLAILALVTASLFGELTGAFPLVRLLTSTRASQNVVSGEERRKPGLLVLAAHYDAPRGGMLLERAWLRRWPSVLFGSVVVVTACAVARALGVEPGWLTVVQFIPTVVLIAISPLLIDVKLSHARADVDPRAGADAAIELAQRYGGRLDHFDLMVLLTGASAHFALGMRAWLRAHRGELRPESTAVIVLDGASGDAARYVMKEGPVFATRLHPTLIDLVADDGAPVVSRELSDAYAARAAGLPAIRVTSDLAPRLIERIDAEIGPRLTA